MLHPRKVGKRQAEEAERIAKDLNHDGEGADIAEEVGAHPEGFKRGGAVAVYIEDGVRVFYDETEERWVPYDEME